MKTAQARFAILNSDEKLEGLTGEGRSAVGHGLEHPFTLNYDLA